MRYSIGFWEAPKARRAVERTAVCRFFIDKSTPEGCHSKRRVKNDRQKDWQTEILADKKTDSQTYWQTSIHTELQIDRQANLWLLRETNTLRKSGTQDRETDRKTDMQTNWQTSINTDKHTDRQTYIQTDRKIYDCLRKLTDRQTGRHALSSLFTKTLPMSLIVRYQWTLSWKRENVFLESSHD